MRIFILVVALTCAFDLSAQAASDTYLCVPDMATGFVFDKASQKWRTAQFSVSGKKYLLKRAANGATWNEFGSPFAPIQCSGFNEWGSTFCTGPLPMSNIIFNEKNLRYQSTYAGDYITEGLPVSPKYAAALKDWPVTTDTPSIEVGTCSSLSE